MQPMKREQIQLWDEEMEGKKSLRLRNAVEKKFMQKKNDLVNKVWLGMSLERHR